jgi:hypothetical protein
MVTSSGNYMGRRVPSIFFVIVHAISPDGGLVSLLPAYNENSIVFSLPTPTPVSLSLSLSSFGMMSMEIIANPKQVLVVVGDRPHPGAS